MIGMVFNLLDHPLGQKIEEVDCHMKKPQYTYKQTYIMFFFNHGLQVLTTSIKMILFESLGHFWDV